MKAEIISIGDEILIGQITDTNSAWLSRQLNSYGIEVYQITSVHDDGDHIRRAMREASQHADLVLMTGGLGPTKDDITKQALCEFFNTRLVLNDEVLAHVEHLLGSRGVTINQLNRDQALVPESCTVIPNRGGTAPCMWFEQDQTIFVSMPGVPFEMKAIVREEILPRLEQTGRTRPIYHQTVLTTGLPESMLAEKIERWEATLPAFIKLAYLPSPLGVRLRLSAYGQAPETMQQAVNEEIRQLHDIIPEYIFGYNEQTMAEVVGNLLLERHQHIAVAESCTGGNIAHFITSVPGCSAWFKGGIVAYSNELKVQLLGVDPALLKEQGAVSEPVVRAMATGIRERLGVDYAVATTGIAGPGGGSTRKPVGTVWIAAASCDKVISERYTFFHNRERNITRSTQTALNMLRKLILAQTC